MQGSGKTGDSALHRLAGMADLSLGMQMFRSRIRHRIVQMSMNVFARKGVDNTRVEDLLRAAQLSRRTFYKYFRNKQEVLTALYDAACDALLAALTASIDRSESVDDKIRAGIDTYLDFHRAAGPLMRVLHEEATRSESPLAPRRRVMQDEVVQLLSTVVSTRDESRVDPLLLRCLIWSMENLSIHLLTETALADEDIEGAKEVMYRLITGVLVVSA